MSCFLGARVIAGGCAGGWMESRDETKSISDLKTRISIELRIEVKGRIDLRPSP